MSRLLVGLIVPLLAVLQPSTANAHCDSTKGPVVAAARAALEAGDPGLVLHWLRAEDGDAMREAFRHTIAVRALGPEARALADRYFYETVVRLHRASEGAPYAGLTDLDPDPIITATDRAVASGSRVELEESVVAQVKAGLTRRFGAVQAAKGFSPGDVAAGRAYVAAYVDLARWVEAVSMAARGATEEPETHR